MSSTSMYSMCRAANRGVMVYLLCCQGKSSLWQAISVLLVLDQLLKCFGGILHHHRKEPLDCEDRGIIRG